MSSLIEIDKLVRQAKKSGVDFGKGDPYNRLRYYTKIGWLPHMTRKKVKSGDVVGHYPMWALERIITIDKLKKQGADKDMITSKIATRTKVNSLYEKVSSNEFKNKLIGYITVSVMLLVLLNEMDVIRLSKSKNQTIIDNIESLPIQITDSGSSFVPSEKNRVFIKNNNVTHSSRVYITFNNNYSPASRYWVSKIEPQKGFYIDLDAPVFDNAEFSWWISN